VIFPGSLRLLKLRAGGLLIFPGVIGCVFAGIAGTGAAPAQSGRVKVALCQILCVDGDREGNFRRIEEALSEAKTRGAAIACFPETSILGWVNPEAHTRAFPIPGKDTERLARLARRYGMMVCIGLAEKSGDRLYDSVVLIGRDGKLLLKHRKINILANLMTPPYTPGEKVEAVETEFGRIGLLICADTFSSEILEKMRARRPDLVLVPYGWAAKPEEWPRHGDSLRDTVAKAARAIGAPVVGTDLVGEITHGPWKGRTYGGQSVVADAEGRILGRAKDRRPDVVVVEVVPGRRSGAQRARNK